MNWRIEKACTLAVRSFDNPKATAVKVCLRADVQGRLCIGLCLLKEHLISSLDIVHTNGDDLLRVQRSTSSTSIEIRQAKIDLAVSSVEIDLWLHFTLRTVRDGVAEVDHIDLEVDEAGQTGRRVDLIIAYPSSASPVSSTEARRRLGS